jgi:hypothetical protein
MYLCTFAYSSKTRPNEDSCFENDVHMISRIHHVGQTIIHMQVCACLYTCDQVGSMWHSRRKYASCLPATGVQVASGHCSTEQNNSHTCRQWALVSYRGE